MASAPPAWRTTAAPATNERDSECDGNDQRGDPCAVYDAERFPWHERHARRGDARQRRAQPHGRRGRQKPPEMVRIARDACGQLRQKRAAMPQSMPKRMVRKSPAGIIQSDDGAQKRGHADCSSPARRRFHPKARSRSKQGRPRGLRPRPAQTRRRPSHARRFAAAWAHS